MSATRNKFSPEFRDRAMRMVEDFDVPPDFLRLRAEAGGDRNAGCGGAAPNGDFGADVLRWKKLYGGLGVGELRRLKRLEDENRKLKQPVADLSLDKHIVQDVLSKKVWVLLGSARLPSMCGRPMRSTSSAVGLT
jgi:hypothetical protein